MQNIKCIMCGKPTNPVLNVRYEWKLEYCSEQCHFIKMNSAWGSAQPTHT